MARAVQLLAVLYVMALAVALGALPARAASIERVSVASDGTEADYGGDAPTISADGRYVAFSSDATNLVPGDTNAAGDIFRHDRYTGVTERVSVASDGAQADSWSGPCSISPDGMYISFQYAASDLVPGDTNNSSDIFVHDCMTGATERVSVNSSGSEAIGPIDLWPLSWESQISAAGRYVVFDSHATNLVPGDTNNSADVFLHDRLTGVTERMSVASDGTQGNDNSWDPAISADGRYVAFTSLATNLVPGDTNGSDDIFVRDRLTGETQRVSLSSSGGQGDGHSYLCSITADGRYVAFLSEATNLAPGDTHGVGQIFLRDRLTGETQCVSVNNSGEQGNGHSGYPSASADGRYVAFTSSATNLVPGNPYGAWGAFVRDRLAGITECVSISDDGSQGYGVAYTVMSPDGRLVVFSSSATNLVPKDHNLSRDVFVRVRWRFRDVPPEQWAFAQVEACAGASVVKGYEDETYRPSLEVTRDQMAVYISRALAGGDTKVPTGPATPSFTDVSTTNWACMYIEYAKAQNVVQGYSDGTYQPGLVVDRGQMAVFVARAIATPTDRPDLLSYTPPTTATFSDVPTNFWAYKYVEYIAQPSIGVTKGYPDGDYHPEYVCTRDQMPVYVARAFGLPT